MTDSAPPTTSQHARLDSDAERLIACLRERLDAPDLAYRDPPSQILGGFDTRILAFSLDREPEGYGGPLIARIFSTGEQGPRAVYEAAAQNALVALRYPAPQVLLAESGSEALGLPFMIMRRLPGRVMLDAFVGPRIGRMATLLGREHARLHSLDAEAFERMLGDERSWHPLAYTDSYYEQQLAYIDEARLDGLRPVFDWLVTHRPPSADCVVCHGDFHPLNLLVSGNEVTGVLDWASVTVAPAAFDVGASIALLGHGPVDLPRPVLPIVRLLRRLAVHWYLQGYRAGRPIDDAQLRYFEALRLLGFLVEAGAQIQGQAGVIAYDRESAFFAPYVRNGILRRLRAISGCAISLPD